MRARELKLRERATVDIDESAAWYNERDDGVGERFRASVRETLLRITANPLAYPRVSPRVRRHVMKHFPFAIYYMSSRVEVLILRVVHSKRDPQTWKRSK